MAMIQVDANDSGGPDDPPSSGVPRTGVDRPPTRRRLSAAATAAAVIAIALSTWWMITPMRSAGFGVVDDHEIVSMLDSRDRLPAAEAPGEVVDRTLEPVGRFRPAYWIGRVGEAVVAGNRPDWWYVHRIALAVVSAVSLLLLLRRWVHPITAAVAGLAVVAGPFSETWFRLGPSEAYAVPLFIGGIALFVDHARSRRPSNRRLSVALALLCTSALAKENFILLTGPIILASVVTARLWSGKRRLAGFVALAITLLNGVGIMWQVGRFGDVYRASRSLTGAGHKFIEMVDTLDSAFAWGLVVIATVAGLLAGRRVRDATRYMAVIAGGLAFVVAPQAFFYSGDALAPRYYYPGSFFVPLVFAASAIALCARGRSVPAMIALVVATGVAGSHVWEQCRAVRRSATGSAQFVAQFEPSIAEAVGVGRDEKAIYVASDNPVRYYEALLSTGIFVRTRLGSERPPVMLAMAETPPPQPGTLADRLMRHLTLVMRHGGEGFAAYRPRAMSPSADCLTVIVGPSAPPLCDRSVVVRGVP